MVHQTISTNTAPAPSASSRIKPMSRILSWSLCALIVGSLLACSTPRLRPVDNSAPPPSRTAISASATPPSMPGSRWVAVDWAELPGWGSDRVSEAWPALALSCKRPKPAWQQSCNELRELHQADERQKQQWLMSRLQPFRIESPDGNPKGLLTAYYEPVLAASRIRKPGFDVPLYAPPAELARSRSNTPWLTRREIETSAQAQAALRGKEIAYLQDPVDAMVLHIQGSGRLQLQEPNGQVRQVRLSFAATNQHPYQSIGRWLLDRKLAQDVSWPGIKAWLAANPQRRDELLWSNPRYVFFREEPLSDPATGPTGAQGLPLTAGRSIAVDPQSLPYGTPAWLASDGAHPLRRLVLAQDTGSAIVGAVRADYYVGSGDEAGQIAGRLRQNLQLWALWPR
jgi:membrane-bound lytic murein transglycosylase A